MAGYNLRNITKVIGFYSEENPLCSSTKELKDQLRFNVALILSKDTNGLIRMNLSNKQLSYLIDTYGITKQRMLPVDFFDFYQLNQYISDTETRSIEERSLTVQLGNSKRIVQRLNNGRINILFHCAELVMRFKVKKIIRLPEYLYESFGH
jgi:hypothetical protein